MTAAEYANSAKDFLPDELSDFHAQKDLFKTLDDYYSADERYRDFKNSWVDNHIFTIDFLLHFLAMHGYKLQKSRKKGVEFYDLRTTLKDFRKRRSDHFFKMLMGETEQDNPTV